MAINQETVCNAAVSGAKAQDVFQQIDYLVWKLQKMDTVDFQNDWKVITLLIGIFIIILFYSYFHSFIHSISFLFFSFLFLFFLKKNVQMISVFHVMGIKVLNLLNGRTQWINFFQRFNNESPEFLSIWFQS